MLAAICDDNQKDREKISGILYRKMKKRNEHLDLAFFECGEDLVDRYEDGCREYDLIFMDIYMPGLNGLGAIRRIREYDKNAAVIFMTASPEFAVESYDVRAFGYLLKPIGEEKAENAINRYLEERYPRVRQSLLMINGASGRRIAYDDICYIESRRMVLRIVCVDGAEYSIRKKLDQVQAELPETRFLRCNQSFIVNMDYIVGADNEFIMENGDVVPIKVREKKKIRDRYFAYLREREW